MLGKYLEQRSKKINTFRLLLADALLRKLREKGSLPLTRAFARELGASRREALRAACLLALRERLHLAAGEDGVVSLSTNYHFELAVNRNAAEYQATPGSDDDPTVLLSVTDPDSEALFVNDMGLFATASPKDNQKKTASVTAEKAGLEKNAGFEVRKGRNVRKTMPSLDLEHFFAIDETE